MGHNNTGHNDRGHNENLRAGEDDPTGGSRGVSGSGSGAAAFPVGVLAGAAMGGVGGVLPGDETVAGHHDAPRDGADEDARGQQPP